MDNDIKVLNNVNGDVDEPAYLLVANDFVGVTDDLAEMVLFIEENAKQGSTYQSTKGYKNELLGMQQRIFLIDESLRDMQSDVILVPEKQPDYNIVPRKPSPNLIYPVMIVKK